ncbi:MAG: beta-lactamase family protein [Spirochaetaceae bacterium]|nr:MAG: beta-lactamase family protein [Spirochaetaceae bacterium]
METRSDNIESLIEGAIEQSLIPGIVLLVSKQGKIVFSRVRGSQQLEPESEIMAEDTIFDLSEITQPLATALLCVMIMGQEKIGVGETIGSFVPDIAKESKDITLGQLLLHTAGLPLQPDLSREFPDSRSIDYDRAVQLLFSVKPTDPPGKQVAFSQTGYLLLGQFLRRVTGARLQELFAQLVAAPCGLADTFFNPPVVLWGRIAATEYCPWRKRWIRGQVHDRNSYCLGGEGGNAGLFATAASVLQMASLFESNGVVNGYRLLSPNQVKLMRTCLTAGLGGKRSIGFFIQDEDSPVGPLYSDQSYGHTGAAGTSVWIEPAGKLISVMLTNRIHLGGKQHLSVFEDFRRQLHALIHRLWG